LKSRYGLDIAIRSLAPAIRASRCTLRICGDGVELPRLLRLSESLGIRQGVIFEGRVSDDVLRLCYQAADICLIPSVALECFGLIVLEAYAAGVPVVATANGALPETVAPVSPGLLVPPRDSRRLGEVLIGLLDGTILAPSSHCLQEYAASVYGADRIMTLYERMYDEALHAN
jgi:glycosyltransferase involved in cell wall biosynthesis